MNKVGMKNRMEEMCLGVCYVRVGVWVLVFRSAIFPKLTWFSRVHYQTMYDACSFEHILKHL